MENFENESQMPQHILQEQSQWHAIRVMRDARLHSTDWLVVKYQEVEGTVPESLKIYRQALRDLPQTYSVPEDVVWPEKPEL
ncbi:MULTISPECIES: phage tail assembly chaperone [unclassified Pseudoalteromonas]|uniref:phage tail assembly chaperone n=1 Tax=unclassified Pseudoalteromonas TaxID=194690 RepID=UPI002097EDC1|nr:phage tail assembly chaperone [Pseudoalteromonas sp. XMcav2-N]MCO7190236.1 phage tail assembly chaperone [Pseudoalteromonas sp. XMcav2-N]